MYDIGILGGMGSKATVALYNLIIDNTDAQIDQDHLDIVILNKASIPDRTCYLTGRGNSNPLSSLLEGIVELNRMCVNYIVIPCNSSHFFYDVLSSNSKAPIINMVENALKYIDMSELPKDVYILGTLGTVNLGIYELFNKYHLNIKYPDDKTCQEIHSIIYDIKNTSKVYLNNITDKLNCIIKKIKHTKTDSTFLLACTELSLLNAGILDEYCIVDAMDLLALSAIATTSGKKLIINKMKYNYRVILDMCKA